MLNQKPINMKKLQKLNKIASIIRGAQKLNKTKL